MEFFHGVWNRTGDDGGGPMTVGDGFTADYESNMPEKEPYRIIYTHRNYVLFAQQLRLLSGDTWTVFRVFTRQREIELLNWICFDNSMRNAEALDWPMEKIEQTFLNGICGQEYAADPDEWIFNYPPRWGYFILEKAGQ